ncbi:MAG: hypothetical protein QOI96_51 [Verrucomicrobiota bacterium]
MSLCIAGMGWVTPLGSGLDSVWQRMMRGDEAIASRIAGPFETSKSYSAFRVPADALTDLPAHPRLRRASAISRFAVAAGLAALKEARSTIDRDTIDRTALVFAVANGGVSYTKRFYHDIVQAGASAASPLLFPETVFNAPASHLAAVLGLTGASYTLVADGAAGILAIRMAEDLMADERFDYCLVVGAEEADWVLCDAYSKWRLLRSEPPIEPFHKRPRGTVLSEGAGAILLARKGVIGIKKVHPGGNFFRRTAATQWTAKVLSGLDCETATVIISSANGTFIDEAERTALSQMRCKACVYSPKAALGESVGASGIWQIIVGAQALLTRQLPPLLHSSMETGINQTAAGTRADETIVLDCGMNQQIAGLRLTAKAENSSCVEG